MKRARLRIHRQHGMALVISLVVLLLLTMLGVTAVQVATLQERMAGNTRDRHMAFQAAESALRGGEQWTETNSGMAAANPLATPAGWNGTAPAASGSVAGLDTQLASDPIFHVGPPQRIRIGVTLPPEFRYIYPVTARGEGGTAAAVVVLQSMYEIAD